MKRSQLLLMAIVFILSALFVFIFMVGIVNAGDKIKLTCKGVTYSVLVDLRGTGVLTKDLRCVLYPYKHIYAERNLNGTWTPYNLNLTTGRIEPDWRHRSVADGDPVILSYGKCIGQLIWMK